MVFCPLSHGNICVLKTENTEISRNGANGIKKYENEFVYANSSNRLHVL